MHKARQYIAQKKKKEVRYIPGRFARSPGGCYEKFLENRTRTENSKHTANTIKRLNFLYRKTIGYGTVYGKIRSLYWLIILEKNKKECPLSLKMNHSQLKLKRFHCVYFKFEIKCLTINQRIFKRKIV